MKRVLLGIFLCLFATSALAGIPCPEQRQNEIIIATFNVYKLGSVADKYVEEEGTASNEIPERVKNIAFVIAAGKFDLVALQEVTSGEKGHKALTDLVKELKATHGLDYKYFLSGYIGQGLMPEAIAFVYTPKTVKPELIPGTPSLVQNIEIGGRDLVRTQWEAGDFDFTLISAHLAWGNKIDRDDGYQKIAQIFSHSTPSPFSEDPDIIVLGDFNRFGKGYDSVKKLKFDGTFLAPTIVIFDPGFNKIKQVTKTSIRGKDIPGDNPQWLSTTVAKNRYAYDMILISPDVAEEYTAGTEHGKFEVDFGILHFDEVGGCGHIQGLEEYSHNKLKEAVSDHRPLWMRFKTNTGNADDGPGGIDIGN